MNKLEAQWFLERQLGWSMLLSPQLSTDRAGMKMTVAGLRSYHNLAAWLRQGDGSLHPMCENIC